MSDLLEHRARRAEARLVHAAQLVRAMEDSAHYDSYRFALDQLIDLLGPELRELQ